MTASICWTADGCGAVTAPPPLPTPRRTFTFGTYDLWNIDRIDTNLYQARTVGADLLIETRLCLALTLLDDGILTWRGVAGSELSIDNFSGDVCNVADANVL